MRYQNVCEWSGCVCHIRPPLELAQNVTDQTVDYGWCFIIWIERVILSLVGTTGIDARLVCLVVHDEHRQRVSNNHRRIIKPANQTPENGAVLLDYKQDRLGP